MAEEIKESKFRLKGQRLFLTYPQCPIEPSEALEQLEAKVKDMKRSINEYIIAQEEHKEEGKHLHCYIQVDKAVDITVATKLDIQQDNVVYHGNYQGVKSDTAVIKYVTKDGNYISSKSIDEL